MTEILYLYIKGIFICMEEKRRILYKKVRQIHTGQMNKKTVGGETNEEIYCNNGNSGTELLFSGRLRRK